MSVAFPPELDRTFETLDGWVPWYEPNGDISLVTDNPRWGARCLRAESLNNKQFQGPYTDEKVVVLPNTQYTVSVYVRSPNADAFSIQLQQTTSGGVFVVNNQQNLGYLPGDDAWRRYSITFTTSATTERIGNWRLFNNETVNTVWFVDGWQIDLGATAQPYDGADSVSIVEITGADFDGVGSLAASVSPFRGIAASLHGEGAMEVQLGVDTPIPPMQIMVRETPKLSEHVIITTPGGNVHRWGEDEGDGRDIAEESSHSSSSPGGYADWTATLRRDPNVDYSDLARLSHIEIFDAANDKIWEGRLERAPEVSGDQIQISPEAVGYQKALEDRGGIDFLGCDPRLDQWGEPSTGRKLTILGAGQSFASERGGDTVAGESQDGILHEFEDFPGNHPIRHESWYRGVAPIGQLRYSFSNSGMTPQTVWETRAYVSNADHDYTVLEGGFDHQGNPSSNQVVSVTNTSSRFALLVSSYSGTFSGNSPQAARWFDILVVGRHGLTLHPAIGGNRGLLSSDIIRHAVSRWGGVVRSTPDSITPSQFVIPISVHQGSTVSEIIQESNRYDLYNWAVWDDKTFHYNPIGEGGRRWKARTGPSRLRATGKDARRIRNGAVVTFTDSNGDRRSVGPTGSGCEFISDFLRVQDPLNEANLIGAEMYEPIEVRGVTSLQGAISIGQVYLIQLAKIDSSGQAEIVGHIEDEFGVLWPHTAVKAGDIIEFTDSNNTNPRLIVDVVHNRSSRSSQITLDAPKDALEAVVDRMQIVIEGV